ncbi:MAG: protein kinase, partial [Candidatus Aminicenantes bacterium]|nr:protein kinase [Candidatus Aminicenantes bacterium]
KRIVALKFLPPELTRDEEAKKRFIHEARAAATLDHPNICTVYEIGETEDGQMFIAMGYYEGQTLKEKIANGPLPLADGINISIQIAEGLQEAHTKGIVHRDIKSANIIITDKGVAKILDFGLAKLKGQTKLTKEGTTLGTVAYMSPEQASGEEADHRSDIWSLGIILYEMITGQVPFKGEYDQAIMYAIMSEDPEPVTGLRTGVPNDIEKIINKTLEKDQSDRYQHADDLIVDLRKVKKDSKPEVQISKKSIQKKIRKPVKLFLIPGIILLMVIVFAGYFVLKEILKTEKALIHQADGIKKITEIKWKNSIAVLPFSNISADKEQQYFCDGMTEDIITKLSYIKDLKVISRTSVMKYKKTEKSIKEIGKELDVENILEGSVRKEKNRIRITAQLIRVADDAHLWAKNYDRNLESIFEVQDEVSNSIAQSLEVKFAPEVLRSMGSGQTKNTLAYEYYLKGMYIFNSRYYLDMNDKNFNAVVDIFKKALEIDPDYARAYGGLAWVYGNHYIYTRDIIYFNKALKFSKKARELAPDSIEGYGGGIGHSYSMMG